MKIQLPQYQMGDRESFVELQIQGPFADPSARQVVMWNVGKPQSLLPHIFQVEVIIQDLIFGRVDTYQWAFGHSEVRWPWMLSLMEFAQIEEMRRGGDLHLAFRYNGIVSIASDTSQEWVPIHGVEFRKVPQSEWENVLVGIGYEPARYLELPLQSRHWPDWKQSVHEMEEARRALARGETHNALRQCLELLEKRQAPPYRPDSWRGVFHVDPQKDEGLREMISGIATYLNKVGHHRSWKERDLSGDLMESEVDHFEAEVLVAMTQLLIAYIHRLPAKTSG